MTKSKCRMAGEDLISRPQELPSISPCPWVALTISPPVQSDLHLALKKWNYRLANLKSNFVLYPEIDRNMKNNTLRLHFHGIISIVDAIAYKKDIDYLQSKCFIKVKIFDDTLDSYGHKLSNFSKWQRYCKKERFITLKTMNIKNKDYQMNNRTVEKYKVCENVLDQLNKK